MEETFFRLLARQTFLGLGDFLRCLYRNVNDAIGCVNRCENFDALLKESKAVLLDEPPKPEATLLRRSSHNTDLATGPRGTITFDAYEGREFCFSNSSLEVLGGVYSRFRLLCLKRGSNRGSGPINGDGYFPKCQVRGSRGYQILEPTRCCGCGKGPKALHRKRKRRPNSRAALLMQLPLFLKPPLRDYRQNSRRQLPRRRRSKQRAITLLHQPKFSRP